MTVSSPCGFVKYFLRPDLHDYPIYSKKISQKLAKINNFERKMQICLKFQKKALSL